MAITINECKCGRNPKFRATSSLSYRETTEFERYEFSCAECRYHVKSGSFDEAVDLWNELNWEEAKHAHHHQ